MKKTYNIKFDIIVVGGGVSGCAAAIAAGRMGKSVLLVEQSGYLGGALTVCGVGPMMTFHSGNKQVIKGIMDEIVCRLKEVNGTLGHIPDPKQYCSTVTPFNSEKLKLVLDHMLDEAGCSVLFHTMIGAVNVAEDKIQSITVCNKDGLNELCASVFVDASGDGDVAAFAGVPMSFGRKEDNMAQPMTMNMKYCNVDTDALLAHMVGCKDEFKRLLESNAYSYAPYVPLALANFREAFEQERKKGTISFEQKQVLMFATDRPGEYLLNTTKILEHDATDAMSLSKAEQLGRKQCEELDAFMRCYAPGFEHALLEITGPSIGVRGSRQLVGTYVLTQEDILGLKVFEDAIACSAYPIDIHGPSGENHTTKFLKGDNAYYTIPYRIMTCHELSNLIVTGRCVSATFEAQAAIRTTPTVGALGHAAGVAAALATERNDSDVRKVAIDQLQKHLVESGAFIGDK